MPTRIPARRIAGGDRPTSGWLPVDPLSAGVKAVRS
jgi:hypothetical protein